MDNDYYPSKDLESALRYWWIIVALMLAGVAAGWLLSRLNRPIYEARAEIAIDFNLSQTGPLSGENQDILINTTGKIINSFPIMSALSEHLQEMGLKVSPAEFDRMAVLERKAESFVMRVQSADPDTAVQLADYWSQLALAALGDASQHADQSQTLSSYLDGLNACVTQLSGGSDLSANCPYRDLASLQEEITRTETAIATDNEAARGFVPGIVYSLNQPAQLLPQPVQNRRTYFLIGGAAIGLVLALWLIHTAWLDRLLRSKTRD